MKRVLEYLLAVFILVFMLCEQTVEYKPRLWKWTCEHERICKKWHKSSNISENLAVSLEVCKMFCSKYGLLWPRPRGDMFIGRMITKVNLNKISVHVVNEGKSSFLLAAAGLRFKSILAKTMPSTAVLLPTGRGLNIFLNVSEPDIIDFSLGMDESYHLNVTQASQTTINATIKGKTFFGVRHGLETLSQLFLYDDEEEHPMIVTNASIIDSPKYTYRGLMLDTSRNYYPISSIKRTIDTMATVKMNSFHWHISDSQSFPFVSERKPNMSILGAYSPNKVYTKDMIRDLAEYALVRGVRLVPELDTPAHIGEGWQGTDLTVCYMAEPWELYCGEPPCGQLNPIAPNVYDYLEDLYTDMAEAFLTSDLFHMGSDEVNERCWRSNKTIEKFMSGKNFYFEETSFLELWSFFQLRAHERVYKAFGAKIPLIIWSSPLTEAKNVEEYVDVDEYIIQVWTGSSDVQILKLLDKGYKMILSNPEQLYLDCGFGDWLGGGQNWCSPYKSWQIIYEHRPSLIAGPRNNLILGSEAALWSEDADGGNLDSRLWPRIGALAERLWTDPISSWRDAQQRMLHLKERISRMGIHTEALQPEWCYYNEGKCDLVAKNYRLQDFHISSVTSQGNAPDFVAELSFLMVIFLL